MTNVDLQYAAHFEDYIFNWDYKTYLAIGSYGSSKSHHNAIKLMLKLMKEKRRAAVIREVYETHLETTYQLLQEVAEVLDPKGKFIKFKKSPLMVEFKNGSKIIFKGLDKVEKMKGLQSVSIVWIEECSEVKYAGFKELMLRLRTKDVSLHILLSTNPVSRDNWVYQHFFKDSKTKITFVEEQEFYTQRVLKREDIYMHHSTVDDNPFVPQSYIDELDKMKDRDFDLYRVARLGFFGVLGERVFNNVQEMNKSEVDTIIRQNSQRFIFKNGLDFGFVTSYNAFIQVAIDPEEKILYIYNEYYNRGESDVELAKALQPYKKEIIRADAADPKAIAYLFQLGFKIHGAKKGAGSVVSGIKKLKRFNKIIISSGCENAVREFTTLTYKKDKSDKLLEDKFSFDAHLLDGCRYSLEDYEVTDLKGHNARRYKSAIPKNYI